MFDSVFVDQAATFPEMSILAAEAKERFDGDRDANGKRPQKLNADGVPVWKVTLLAVNDRERPDMLTVTVAMHGNPMEKFSRGDMVELPGLRMGVMPKNGHTDGKTYGAPWFNAQGIVAATK